ncbi:tRNA (adenosine(37)-N6)-threonylcarbamoyltransferase complex ATPase subunit type 1 TsaE [Candidatus Dependentiae bacterium]|nr:tRNA (adenosine(37)-N6)-threonylcarbamoyltransferase complex ATPase subunit type 1 TsaE [Candidatus Dependentiae bacterium]
MIQEKLIYSINELPDVANKIKELMKEYKIFAFVGSLGAGKTTLIREILKNVGVKETISSPTFAYVNSYTIKEGKIYHFDLYRLKSLDDFIGAGFAEILHQPDSWSFIEWPEIIMPILTENSCIIFIDYQGLDNRILHYKCIPKS